MKNNLLQNVYSEIMSLDTTSGYSALFLDCGISKDDINKLRVLVSSSKSTPIELHDMWSLLDIVWDELGLDNRNVNQKLLAAYYLNPVWVLNGLFIENDKESLRLRQKVVDYIAKKNVRTIMDFGGGFGTLARMLAIENKNIDIDIFEPHPSDLAQSLVAEYEQVQYVGGMNKQYDCVIATDVLEHVDEPVQLVKRLSEYMKPDGYVVFANCFLPVIKCHLPTTFHLKYSFRIILYLMGFEYKGSIAGRYAQVFQKGTNEISCDAKVKVAESISKSLYPVLKSLNIVASTIKGS